MTTRRRGATVAKKPVGAPSVYSKVLADKIVSELAEGRSLRAVCKDKGMPNISTVIRWLGDEKRDEFRAQYARAREAQAETLAEEILSIADDGSNDTYMTENGPAVNQDVIARSRLRVDTRKWLASKMAPKKYGDKLAVGGADDLPPVQVTDPARPKLTKAEWLALHGITK